jgi:restriction system protein
MSIPKYHELFLPVLKLVGSGIGKVSDMIPLISKEFSLTDDEMREKISDKNRSLIINNRIYWGLTYIYQAGLLTRISPGNYGLSGEGKRLVESNIDKIDINFLGQYELFKEFIKRSNKSKKKKKNRTEHGELYNYLNDNEQPNTPDEKIEEAFAEINNIIISELKNLIMQLKPTSFERLVLKVMKEIGYNLDGILEDTSGLEDGGINGVIYEDALGLNSIYLQAKHYNNIIISKRDIQNFAGAMDGEGATKGVFVTTSIFSEEVKNWVKQLPKQIKLIDGDELVSLMFNNNIGIRTYKIYDIMRIDNNFFDGLDE